MAASLVLSSAVALAVLLLAGGGGGGEGPASSEPAPPSAGPAGTTYYVSPQGSDEADGRSPGSAWATVERLHDVRLRPGDRVLFRGGATFDAEVRLSASGTAGARIVYGSYGDGRARFTRSIFLDEASWIVIQDLELAGAEQGIASLGSRETGARGNRIRGFPGGSAVSVRRHDSRIEDNEIDGGLVGISWFQEDSGTGTSRWRDNRISGTTDAGIYVSPSDAAGQTRESFVITGNVLSPTRGRHMNLAPSAGRYTVARNVER